jgi:SWIM zinc finger
VKRRSAFSAWRPIQTNGDVGLQKFTLLVHSLTANTEPILSTATSAARFAKLLTGGSWLIHGYSATLNYCACKDFFDRNLPCKHIYAAALDSKIILPLTYADYDTARKQALEIVFEFRSIA